MRRRLLASTLAIALAGITLFGIPLAFVLNRVVHDDARSRLENDASRIARELTTGDSSQQPTAALVALLRRSVPTDDGAIIRYPSGQEVTTPVPRRAITATVPGPAGTEITVATPVADVEHRVRSALVVVVALAVLALIAAFVLALMQSSRLSNPLARLSIAATRLGEGDFSLATPRSGIPEIDGIAVALDNSATRIDHLFRAERGFSTHASHQLRSALTGLELRLEELARNPDAAVQEEANAALDQTHRLTVTIEELLALARTGRAGMVTHFDLADLARHHVVHAAAELTRRGRRLVLDAPARAPVVAAAGAVGQALEILLSNAVRHGAGTVSVSVVGNDEHVAVEVSDEGTGVTDEKATTLFRGEPDPEGHGIGLPLARTLVTAEGGTITLVQAAPPVFRIELPRVPGA